jgi:hypothetical protein
MLLVYTYVIIYIIFLVFFFFDFDTKNLIVKDFSSQHVFNNQTIEEIHKSRY